MKSSSVTLRPYFGAYIGLIFDRYLQSSSVPESWPSIYHWLYLCDYGTQLMSSKINSQVQSSPIPLPRLCCRISSLNSSRRSWNCSAVNGKRASTSAPARRLPGEIQLRREGSRVFQYEVVTRVIGCHGNIMGYCRYNYIYIYLHIYIYIYIYIYLQLQSTTIYPRVNVFMT